MSISQLVLDNFQAQSEMNIKKYIFAELFRSLETMFPDTHTKNPFSWNMQFWTSLYFTDIRLPINV